MAQLPQNTKWYKFRLQTTDHRHHIKCTWEDEEGGENDVEMRKGSREGETTVNVRLEWKEIKKKKYELSFQTKP